MVMRSYQPAVQVLLKKTIGRSAVANGVPVATRYAGKAEVIDLTPFLGDGGGVRTSKSLREPAGGFNITFTDQMDPVQFDSLYGLIEPMDVVEIRMAHNPTRTDYANLPAGLPIIMRGFVSSVMRGRAMGDDGTPVRTVTVTGQDYGKVWQMMQIWFNPFGTIALDLVTSFPLFERYGVAWDQNLPAHTFVDQVRSKIINVFLDGLIKAANPGASSDRQSAAILPLRMADQVVTNGVVSPFGINGFQGGSVFDMLRYYTDVGPFHELYVEDREDAPYVVFRPLPFADAAGNLAFAAEWDGKLEAPLDLTTDVIVAAQVERSDGGVANYYWVDSARYALNGTDVLKMTSTAGDPNSYFLTDYQNASPGLYGLRKMEVSSQMGGNGELGRDGMPASQLQSDQNNGLAWLADRRQKLMVMNRDNALFESGTLRLRGFEGIRAGMQLRFTEGGLVYTVYVVGVDHEFLPYQGYFTTVRFERGTGFIARVQKAAGTASPYLSELNNGGVYG